MLEAKAVIFDCDGVLFDSHRANLAYYNRIFARFGHPAIEDPLSEAAHICHTASSPVVLARLLDETLFDEALSFARQLDYREFLPLMTEATGLRTGLARLAQHMPLAVATNRGGSMSDVLEHFDLAQHFSVVVTSHDVERPKPAPDMLLLAARRLGFAPQHCLFVGDSELDHQAARDAGMPFAAYGEGGAGEYRVRSHVELAAMLLGPAGS